MTTIPGWNILLWNFDGGIVGSRVYAEYILMGALMSGEAHGYDIMQFLKNALGSAFHLATSQMYVLLKRLENDGLIVSSVELQDTLPSRRVFSLTNEGQKIFLEWIKSPVEHVRDLRIEFPARIYFIHRLSLRGGESLIRSQVRTLKKIKDKISRQQSEEKDPFIRLVFGQKIAMIDSWIKWINHDVVSFILKT